MWFHSEQRGEVGGEGESCRLLQLAGSSCIVDDDDFGFKYVLLLEGRRGVVDFAACSRRRRVMGAQAL